MHGSSMGAAFQGAGWMGSVPEAAESRRVHERVRQYWQSLKDNRLFPAESEVEPAVIADVWDYCFVVNLTNGPVKNGFHYDYMGPALVGAYGVDMAGIELCDPTTKPHIASMLRHFEEVRESGEPATDESEFINASGTCIKYRCCLLPLGRNRVEYILGCMRWKEI